MPEDVRITRRIHKLSAIPVMENNQVLLKMLTNNMEATTEGGLYKASALLNRNQYLDDYANRVGEVIAIPDHLVFYSNANKTSDNAMRWDCDIEIEVGDKVWTSYPSVLDCEEIIIGGESYLMVNYRELRMAKRDDYIMLNGWVMYETPLVSKSSILIDPHPDPDYTKGIVLRTGKKNRSYYRNGKWIDMDLIDVKVGDKFLKADHRSQLRLEDPLFVYYEKPEVMLIQRKDVLMIL